MIKLIDFGHSTFFEENEIFSQKVGTPYYMSPEVLKKEYNYKSDIWSLGVVFMFMMTKQRPYDNTTIDLLFKSILYNSANFYSTKIIFYLYLKNINFLKLI